MKKRTHGTRARASVLLSNTGLTQRPAMGAAMPEAPELIDRIATGAYTGQPQMRRYRVDGWTPKVREDFLDALTESLNITRSCEKVSKTVRSYYELRKRDPEFDQACEDVMDQAYAALETALVKRATQGTERQVIDRENKIVTLREFDSRLGIRLLQIREQRKARKAAETAKREAEQPAAAPQEPPMTIEEQDAIQAQLQARLKALYDQRKEWEARVIRAEAIAGIKPEDSALPFG